MLASASINYSIHTKYHLSFPMTTTLLFIIQVFIVILLVTVILVQKTSSDSLAGLSGGGNSLISSKSSSNIFSKATLVLAIVFVLNSLLIAKITNVTFSSKESIIDQIGTEDKGNKSIPSLPEGSE